MGHPDNPLAGPFEAAAGVLVGGDATGSASDSKLLGLLGYSDGDRRRRDNRVSMLRAAAQFRRLFQLPVPDAPGLIFFGGEADPAVLGDGYAGLPIGYLAGSGLSPQRAFEACVGEGIEYLSQFRQPDDPVDRGLLDRFNRSHDRYAREFIAGVLAAGGYEPDRVISWVPARRPASGVNAWFPLDISYRRSASEQEFKPPLKLSSGCAAGPTMEAAALRGLLELVERDAVALWWRGGRRGRSIGSDAAGSANNLLARLREGTDRGTWLLDITTDVGIPVVAAMSARPDGYGFAVGFGARPNLADAAESAVFELCQAELGQHVVAAKQSESGDRALRENDLRILRRAASLDTRTCALLHPVAAPGAIDRSGTVPTDFELLANMLETKGIAIFLLDLTRAQFGVPVVRVLAPALQAEPCDVVGARLARAVAETGGGHLHHAGIALF